MTRAERRHRTEVIQRRRLEKMWAFRIPDAGRGPFVGSQMWEAQEKARAEHRWQPADPRTIGRTRNELPWCGGKSCGCGITDYRPEPRDRYGMEEEA